MPALWVTTAKTDAVAANVSAALEREPENALGHVLEGLMLVVDEDETGARARLLDAARFAAQHGVDSDGVLVMNNSAWMAAKSPPPPRFSSEQGMDYAHAQATAFSALMLAPRNGSFMNTWGVARCVEF